MRTAVASLCCVLLLLLTACSASAPPRPAATRRSQLTATAPADRVVLLSFDGLGADALSTRGPASLTRAAAGGTFVKRVVPVNPTATSSTHAAILTGAGPDRTGIVANRFHVPGTPMQQMAEGLHAEIHVETLIDVARKSGKRVGSIAFPTVDGATARRSGDFGVVYSRPVTSGRTVELTADDFRSEWMPPTWGSTRTMRPSFSPILRARLTWELPQRARVEADLVAYDNTDDSRRNYDSFYIETQNGEVAVSENGWFPIATKLDDGLWGSWSKIIRRDPSLESVSIYWGPISRTVAYPASFAALLEEKVGFWPARPDDMSAQDWLAGRPGIDPDTFAEQAERLSDYLLRATTTAIGDVPFDLLLTYQPVIDQSEHQFRIVLTSQWQATAENRAAGERVRRRAYAAADRAITTIAGAVDTRRDAVVVTGDHGLGAVDTEVRLGAVLQNSGLNDWIAFAGGNVAHIYRRSGAGEKGKKGSSEVEVLRALNSLRAADGTAIFELVSRKLPGSHPNSGDIMAIAYPRFILSGGTGPMFAASAIYAQHGGLNTHPEFHTVLGAWGAGVARTTIESIRQTEIARFVSALLGMPPPGAAE